MIVVDDEIARGTTVLELLAVLRRHEVRSICVACTHGLFADGALEKLAAAEDVIEIVSTNSVPMPAKHPKLTCCRWRRRWPRPSAGRTTASP